ncbi:class II fructose-1,6-bisphosphate aldolase [Thermotoga sp. RQ2]|uniref:class II fructose-1,6-bisphosphate aldolase n=1 Tax=Thermotoga sp. (strain RQ2) TaxID=126740 RepID=UPI0001601C65|nr:class II fructose-1,6-bisphosphate aldolase [Thermotoga sp. RQ2]ACB09028.1 fructose-1,6-bisphosphate aldolase, class II [Thermotoga sp. RQ2]
MPYVKSTKEILEKASKERYAVGAFNFNNMEFLQAILEAAEEEKAPVIVATSEGAIKYIGKGDIETGAKLAVEMVRTYAEKLSVPVALHLDHGRDFKIIMAAIKAGYSSVMIDASHLPFEENLRETKRIVEIAHAVGISVEAELGKLKGIEDNVVEKESVLVDPEEAKVFVKETEVDFLAPAIGTSHGAFKFKGEAQLDFERLKKVKEYTQIPLVLHGASMVPQDIVKLANEYGAELSGAKGVPEDMLKKAIELGINKINTDTDLRITFVAYLRKVLSEDKSQIDPRKIFKPVFEQVKEIVKERIRIFGSSGKA